MLEVVMKSLSKSLSLLILFATVFSVSGCSAFTTQSSALTASGLIETNQVAVSSELGGRVVDVPVKEGDQVHTGDALIKLDDTSYKTQRSAAVAAQDVADAAQKTAQANLDAALVQYDITLAAARAQDKETRTDQWKNPDKNDFDQPSWYFTREEQIRIAQAEVDVDQAAIDQAKVEMDDVIANLDNNYFLKAEDALATARLAFQTAKDTDERAKKSNDSALKDAAKKMLDDAKDDLTRAQDDYDKLLSTQAAKDVLDARAKVAVRQERYQATLDRLAALQTGEYSLEVTAAQKSVQQAQAMLDQTQAAKAEAAAQLALIDDQIAKLVVTSPIDGVVLTRSIQPGEVIQPGMAAISLGKMNDLKVTVYIPEDRYGQINLGDKASLSVDAFPGVTFEAVVNRIADQAEYTPNNVQTKEQRQTTVYAIQLSVNDPDGKLKPGMPADVTFAQ